MQTKPEPTITPDASASGATKKPAPRALLTLPGGILLFQRAFVITGCEKRGDAKDKYMTRYRLIEKPETEATADKPARPGFGLYLHVFYRSDRDVYHNHPWDFTSLMLWGGYIEEVPTVYPNWQTDPESASKFDAIVRRSRAFIRRQPGDDLRRSLEGQKYAPPFWSKFCGRWTKGVHYVPGSVVLLESVPCGGYYGLTGPDNGIKPSDHRSNWMLLDPSAPRCLDVRPLTRNYRPAFYVHRVKLHPRRDGTERPAVTLVWRGPKIYPWGFWRRFTFTPEKAYFDEFGC